MRILLTGSGGMLGRALWNELSAHELVAIGRHQPDYVETKRWQNCDLTDSAKVYALITKANPDLVLHCAAMSSVDEAEQHPEKAFQVNAIGTRNVALACQRFDTVMTHISTDYVFDGKEAPGDGYREFDKTAPLSVYAESKVWAEQYVSQLLNKFFIIRTSWLFGPGRASFIDQVIAGAESGKEIPCLTDVFSCPTSTLDLAKAIARLIETSHYGIYHLTNEGGCNRVELGKFVIKALRASEQSLRPTTQRELRLAAKRPSFSVLKNLAWQSDGFAALRPWQEALDDYLRTMLMVRK